MEAIYPITSLVREPASIKAEAQKNVVHLTEHGSGAYIFCSEEVFDQYLQAAKEQALLEHEMAEAIEDGRADYYDGRVYKGTDKLREALKKSQA
ncbi:MAG: sodium:proline symporter [Eggerthellaceae bacterium]|jgi:PHD/YefM family antitoxin component YafN of YafNO toxin-antitoxin module|nr:sodium:proline symporter [Eggerthellaceae bacterium]